MPLLVLVSLIWALSFGLIKRWLPGVDSAFIATARLGLALVVFLPFLRLKGVTVATAGALVAIGAVQFGLMYLAYLASFPYLSAYEVALFTITTPIFVTLFADALDRQLRPHALFAALLAMAGTAFVVVRLGEVKLALAGLALVQLSNAAFAIGQVAYRRLHARQPGLNDRNVFALLYAGGFAVALAVFLSRGVDVVPHGPQVWTIAYLGVVASGLGFFLWNVGATRVEAGTLAVMNNAKIPLGITASLLVFGEQANLPRLLASLVVMSLAVWVAEKKSPGESKVRL
ncbi:MAG: EamA family transporter [Opitutus sp.]|nr:EamA family transporter [Opitutus sp.]